MGRGEGTSICRVDIETIWMESLPGSQEALEIDMPPSSSRRRAHKMLFPSHIRNQLFIYCKNRSLFVVLMT